MFQVSIYACPSLEGGSTTSAELAGILRTDVAMHVQLQLTRQHSQPQSKK